jgi:hypothetical protein
MKLATSKRQFTCANSACRRAVERKARQQRFCSSRCKETARERVRKAGLGTDTGVPAHPRKFLSQINTVRGQKTATHPPEIRGRGWRAPARVIAAHLPSGAEVVSADGIVSFVVQLTRSALGGRR